MGFWIWFDASKEDRHVKLFGAISILTALGSAFYHASGTLYGGMADYTAMVLTTAHMTGINVRRWLHLSVGAMYSVAAATLIAVAIVYLAFPEDARFIYALGAPCCFIELRLFFRDRHHINYKFYLYSWVAVGVATVFWWLDLSKVWCTPNNHTLSGHALWHVFMAAGLYLIYRYYLQFSLLKSATAASSGRMQ